MEETRVLNVIYNKSGSGSMGTKLSIPISFFRELGVTETDRSVEVTLKSDKIVIRKAKNE
ncbi:TPA: AbrB/MazE/SpoVT family DNA-binding domain-containing protein [Clostridioides difficile]|nr:PemI [Clostridioides difficile]MDB0374853.1 PemI [Clostridioides difficile]MDB2861912.1 PemI [Clostridioides difficile]HBF1977296.1 AbrB/MazE/SpoVT family DNA-binding domain-containing protein [Clostridioides difficile]HBG6437977.1 AbrB/MazE/SpoVT family DNA-binding domain-containing protein [Clostridioides difficile]